MNTDTTIRDDEDWAPVSDLMAVLMLVFMFIAIVFVRAVVIKEHVFREECNKIYRELNVEFYDDFVRWQADLFDDLTVRFHNPEVLFLTGDDDIRPEFELILSNFFPRYMDVVAAHRSDIKEIRIEGHTSSVWGDLTRNDAYFENMELSQSRTRSILKYILNLPQVASYEWARKHITANGLSSSNLIYNNNGTENKERSQRVEFRLLTSSCQQGGVYEY